MRIIALVPALLACIAAAADPAAIDLDKPGALGQLRQDNPRRYEAVAAVLRASERMPCKSSQMETLETRYDLKDLKCGVAVFTSFPAQRRVSFNFDGTSYFATVVLKDAGATVQSAISTNPAGDPAH